MEGEKLEKKVCSRVNYVRDNMKWVTDQFDDLANSERMPERIAGNIYKKVFYPVMFFGCYIACFFDSNYKK